MRKKYLIITGVKLLISQWHVNGLVGILSKPTFNLQLTQSSPLQLHNFNLQLITILPIYYSVIILRKGRNRKIFYILNHWVFWELRKKWFRRKRRNKRREKELGAGCSDETGQVQPKQRWQHSVWSQVAREMDQREKTGNTQGLRGSPPARNAQAGPRKSKF